MSLSVSIVIPTYGREQVLVDTIQTLLNQSVAANELLVIDQTPEHEEATRRQLQDWHDSGRIEWVRREIPGIPQAMNLGLLLASSELVLFLDDDIIPARNLVEAHLQAHAKQGADAIVGQVLQPGQEPLECQRPVSLKGLREDLNFPFFSTVSRPVANVMAGNLSVQRERAISIGGFDEQFRGSAYRFETEFARRLIATGGMIWFCAEASIHHLRVPSGGTRQRGDHRSSADPRHGVGDYYYAMKCGQFREALPYMLKRTLREVCTKYHLRHPWAIPVKLCGELRAWRWAWQLHREGPILLDTKEMMLRGVVR